MSNYSDGAFLGFLVFLAIFWVLFAVALYVVHAWFLMKIFDKAGVQGRWRAWVPVYNWMVLFKLGDLSPWLVVYGVAGAFVLGLIPFLNVLAGLVSFALFVLSMLAVWRVGLKLQKEAVWLVLYFFLSLVWLGIAAFDRSRWNTAIPAAPWASNGFLADRTIWEGIPAQVPAGGYPANPATSPAPGYAPPPAPPTGYAPPAAPPAAAPQPPVSPEPPAAPEEPKA